MRQLSPASRDDHAPNGRFDWRLLIAFWTTISWNFHRQCSLLVVVGVMMMFCCSVVYHYTATISVVSVTLHHQSALQSSGNRRYLTGYGGVGVVLPTELRELLASSSNETASSNATDFVEPDLARQFATKMTDKERTVMAKMLKRLTDALDAANLTYYMCGGTLIGSYRHHGMVPWDDDVDIYVRWSERDRIESTIRRHLLPAGYHIAKRQTIWKLFPVSADQSSPIPPWSWRYPFVDVCFYLEDSTTVWDPETRWFPHFRFSRSIVYPLQRRPFMNMSLWAPRDVETYLLITYGNLSQCSTHHYSHRHERGAGQVFSVDCRRLWSIHPFVFRSIAKNPDNGASVVIEELRIGKRKLNTVLFSNPS